MFAGRSGAIPIRGTLVPAKFPVAAAAPVTDVQPAQIHGLCNPAALPHSLRILSNATLQALAPLPAGLLIDAVVFGGHTGTAQSGDSRQSAAIDASRDSTSDALQLLRQMLDGTGHGPADDRDFISMHNLTVSSNQAIGLAFQRIRAGAWERVLVGAAYGGCGPRDLMNFHLLSALSTSEDPARASQPFSKTRSGFVLGEGAAVMILENQEAAQKRGALSLAAVTGYSATSDAYRITDGRDDVLAAAGAIRTAIADAGISEKDISAISAHGTATKMNDRLETRAIKSALGDAAYNTPVISLKSQVGHCLATAGAMDAIASLIMLNEQRLAPTINYDQADPECDLDYVANVPRPAKLERILSNNFGFGGQNSCVVFERVH
jgi:3-oxoacyl-[acyl-carrier-protein] synthase II